MPIRVTVVSSATAEPMATSDAKAHLRVTSTDDDAYIGTLISAARAQVEAITGQRMMPWKHKLYLDEWPDGDFINLPFAPLVKIPSTGVTYKKSTGATATMSSTKWEQDTVSKPGRLALRYDVDWPTETLWNVNPVCIEFWTGYSTFGTGATTARAKVPPAMIHAMKIMISDMYESRESVVVGQSVVTMPSIPGTVKALLGPFRLFSGGF